MACTYSQQEEDTENQMFSEDLVSFDHLTTWSVETLTPLSPSTSGLVRSCALGL